MKNTDKKAVVFGSSGIGLAICKLLIERGYDDICGKLRSLGADIKKINVPDEVALPQAR